MPTNNTNGHTDEREGGLQSDGSSTDPIFSLLSHLFYTTTTQPRNVNLRAHNVSLSLSLFLLLLVVVCAAVSFCVTVSRCHAFTHMHMHTCITQSGIYSPSSVKNRLSYQAFGAKKKKSKEKQLYKHTHTHIHTHTNVQNWVKRNKRRKQKESIK